jgi:RNA polymerase sigma-70 factor (ECF subfamily)
MRLLAAYQGRIYGFVFTLVHNRSETEELLQQISIVLWHKFDTFRPEGDFVRWACGVAYFEILHHLRSKNREVRAISESLLQKLRDHRLEHGDLLEQRRDALGFCLERLGAQDRTLVEQYYFCGNVTASDVSQKIGRSVEAIYKSLQRVRLALHQCIEDRLAREDQS